MRFKFNPISEIKDTIPEYTPELKLPITFDYSYAFIEVGDNIHTQVKTIIKFSNDKVFERFEEFLVPKEELELCVTQSIQNFMFNLGLTEEHILSLFKVFNFDSSKTMSFNY